MLISFLLRRRFASSVSLNGLKGMPDFFGTDCFKMRHLEQSFKTSCESFGFTETRTPVLEKLEVFARALGDSSDVISKEMFTFEDNGGRKICLRPENTAGIVRAVLSNNMLHPSLTKENKSSPSNPSLDAAVIQKLFYVGPMFRYENPQKGRLRQFTQFGVELIADRAEYTDVQVDAEIIFLAAMCLKKLGLLQFCKVRAFFVSFVI